MSRSCGRKRLWNCGCSCTRAGKVDGLEISPLAEISGISVANLLLFPLCFFIGCHSAHLFDAGSALFVTVAGREGIMNREYHKWWSQRLGRDMELLVFGHSGVPAIVFPTSQ